MLRIDEAAEGRHYPEIVRQPAVAQQIEAALAGTADRERRADRPARRRRHADRAHRAGRSLARARRGRRAARHHRPAARRSDPPRLRRQRLARAAHAADRDPRLRRSARRRRRPRRAGASSRSSSRHTHADGAPGARSAAPGPARRRPGNARARCPARSTACSARSKATSRDCSRRGGRPSSARSRRTRRPCRAIPPKLQDALRNLLENATNHSPEGGRDRHGGAPRRRSHPASPSPTRARASRRAICTRIFERFYRVDKSRTREGKDPGGTGLGLSIVRHLVELHGGRVSAANRPERGAVFTVELPA